MLFFHGFYGKIVLSYINCERNEKAEMPSTKKDKDIFSKVHP
jgi:hypothetical protein